VGKKGGGEKGGKTRGRMEGVRGGGQRVEGGIEGRGRNKTR